MRVTDSIKLNSSNSPLVIGIAGGSGSGKTFFANALKNRLGDENCNLVYQDNFYIDQSHKFDFDGGSVNFDHPDSIDFSLLAEKIKTLKTGHDVEIPVYDFATHKRLAKGLLIKSKPVILIDGILILHAQQTRSLFDVSFFIKTSEELRYKRRLERDVAERGRTPEGVKNQFYSQVKVMHDLFVEPSQKYASEIIFDADSMEKQLILVAEKVKELF